MVSAALFQGGNGLLRTDDLQTCWFSRPLYGCTAGLCDFVIGGARAQSIYEEQSEAGLVDIITNKTELRVRPGRAFQEGKRQAREPGVMLARSV